MDPPALGLATKIIRGYAVPFVNRLYHCPVCGQRARSRQRMQYHLSLEHPARRYDRLDGRVICRRLPDELEIQKSECEIPYGTVKRGRSADAVSGVLAVLDMYTST